MISILQLEHGLGHWLQTIVLMVPYHPTSNRGLADVGHTYKQVAFELV